MRKTCEVCGLTFIGSGWITRWSDHTWTHITEGHPLYPLVVHHGA